MSTALLPHVTFEDVQHAAERIEPYVHRTPILRSATVDRSLSALVLFKYESFQKAGAFKARGAVNAVLSLDEELASRGVLTHSSGNHGAALAYASSIRDINCTVVMPEGAPGSKIEAVRGYGADVVFCRHEEREERTQDLQESSGATLVHPYEHPDVIAGQGTVALELLEDHPDLDVIVAPIGGGGLLSGITVTAHTLAPSAEVIGAEPEAVDDAHRSLLSEERQPGVVPAITIADGLRTGLGQRAFDILIAAGVEILTVSEQAIASAARFHLDYMKTVVEPSGAVPLAALQTYPGRIERRKVGVVVSGGNTDFAWLTG